MSRHKVFILSEEDKQAHGCASGKKKYLIHTVKKITCRGSRLYIREVQVDGLAVFLFELFPFISPELKPKKHTIKAWVLLAPRQKPCLVPVVRLPSEHSARDNTGSRRDKTKRMVPFLGPASL